ncbi:MAG: glycosyltransferase family 1 protein [Proteobacteria bacterium]|nr:glycosyltransferase family 1 protein [Pseudomonadota bacterium]
MSEPLRIGVDARPLHHPTSGIGRYLGKLLAEFLQQSPHRWYLYTDRPLNTDFEQTQVQVRAGHIAIKAASSLFCQRTFPRWAKEDQLDLFWSPRHHLPVLDIPSVVTIHDLVWRKQPETMIRLGRIIESLLMPGALTRATTILTPSISTAEDIRDYRPDCSDKIVVTPLAPTLEPSEHPGPPSQRSLLFVGTIEPRKNLLRVIDAFMSLSGAAKLYTLKVAGHQGWKNTAELKRLNDPALKGRVQFMGAVTDDQLQRLYAEADFLVAPSLYEGCGLQILDALAFGKPVITSNISSLPEVAGKAGLLVDPRSVPQIADAIRTLIEDPSTYERLRANAVLEVQAYSWRSTARSTLSALEGAALTPKRSASTTQSPH